MPDDSTPANEPPGPDQPRPISTPPPRRGEVAPARFAKPADAAEADQRWMQDALRLATAGQGHVEPNPMVGCVLVRDGRLIGQGYHRKFGGPHAEVEAIRDCLANGQTTAGCTAYVTLEPCCHHGKTPPCTGALIDAQVHRVVIAVADPFKQVDHGGIRQLTDAGIRVAVGVLESEARFILAPYLKRIKTGIPWMIAKWAMTADGRIATVAGQSQWITGTDSRADVHQTRGRVDAIVVGMGTVSADDPLLTARPPGARVAQRLVFCRTSLPGETSRLVQTADQIPTTCVAPEDLNPVSQKRLADLGVRFLRPTAEPPCDQVARSNDCGPAEMDPPLRRVMRTLSHEGATNVLLECGGRLMASFLSENLPDEFHIYVGAKVFGGHTAPGPVGGAGISAIGESPALELVESRAIGEDVKIIYRRK
ncbi:Riboflavin biosynthesis protein RibD [Crateriforma conspicua]|uniref:Riboflavin biosynthesis protein RibD n=1 Tax=Crateriforma conspicua TaxID=2527996 RepID=A0A5C6FSG7_9PLAN|nr:bifunctional diaminohydroxyphosphoribosylaminopyrimidine deaminase/5-amino-6-(5-phosphoribosylamino)uracil reductase RibD [Crateriforma conspicua]TWU65977.1 Riboflavin biosynthesis protein RibD [Crateriforma conspicua]